MLLGYMTKQNKTISIEEDIFNRLKKESNASDLIERLLKAYFKETENPDANAIKERIKAVEAQKQAYEGDLMAVTIKEQERQQAIETDMLRRAKEAEAEKVSPEFLAHRKSMQREAFDLFDIPKEKKDSLFDEYFAELDLGMVRNLTTWAANKGFKKKERRI